MIQKTFKIFSRRDCKDKTNFRIFNQDKILILIQFRDRRCHPNNHNKFQRIHLKETLNKNIQSFKIRLILINIFLMQLIAKNH